MGDTPSNPALVPEAHACESETDGGSLAYYTRLNNMASLNSLLPTRDARRLERLTENLPLGVTSLWGYEFALHDLEPSSDILMCVHKPGIFKTSLETDAAWERVIAEPYLTRMRALVSDWATTDSSLGRVVSNLWFEYDYEGIGAGTPTPNVFYGPKSNCHSLEKIGVAQEIFERLEPGGLPKGTFRSLARCMSWLVEGGTVIQIGQMLARGENRLRVFIQRIPVHGILPFLNRIGYPHGTHPGLQEQLEWCYRLADSVDLDIDLADTPGEKIGLECYFDSMGKVMVFLDHLYERKLCDADKYQKLRHHLGLLHLQRDQAFVHFFSHFKLGFHPAQRGAAKVYLGYVERGIASQVIRTSLSKPN